MKTILQMMGSLLIVLLLTMSNMFSSGSGISGNSTQKEKTEKSGWIGIMIQDVNAKIARKAKLDSQEGVYVSEVVEDSPADSAGIKEGDVIVELDGKKLFDSDDLLEAVSKTPPGTKVSLLIVRGEEKKMLSLMVGKKKGMKHRPFGDVLRMPDMHPFFGEQIRGVRLLTLNDQLGEYFGAPNNEGVLVEEVERKSTFEKTGFKAGDIIIRTGKKTIDAVEKIHKELQKYNEGDKVEFEIIRKGVKKVIIFEVDENKSIQKEFFFRIPHDHRFHADPFDDTEMQLEMDELQPDLDGLQKEFEQTISNLDGGKREMGDQLFRHMFSSPKPVKL